MRVCAVLAACLVWGGAAQAATFAQCTKVQISAAGEALEDARALVLQAVEAVDDTAVHARWFGRWEAARAGTVRQTLMSVEGALRSEALKVVCPSLGRGGCTSAIFAWVVPGDLVINLCPSFFAMPGVAGIVAGGVSFETGTREGTIIHEVSHFEAVAATGDHCYGRSDCAVMARRDPGLAVRNADSYQYFVEDVALGLRQE
jgi:peptidyl-Lys metalloendopeptidase